MLPVYVINLDRRPNRWAAMSAQLERLDIEAERIAAVDGRLIARQDAWEAETNGNATCRILTPAEEGCLLSHGKAMSAFLGTGASHALILEDDVELATDLRAALETPRWWPCRAVRVVKLEASRAPQRAYLLSAPVGQTPCGRDIQPIVMGHSGAAAYIADRAGAELFLARAPHLHMTADSVMYSRTGSPLAPLLNACLVNPGMARQHLCGDSDIGTDRERSRHRARPRGARLAYKAQVLAARAGGRVRRYMIPYTDGG